MGDRMKTYSINWEPDPDDEPLPECPAGWEVGYVAYTNGVLSMSMQKAGRDDVRFYEDQVDGDTSDAGLQDWDTEEAEVERDQLEEFGIELYQRLSRDVYGAAIDMLAAIRQDLLAAHLPAPVPTGGRF